MTGDALKTNGVENGVESDIPMETPVSELIGRPLRAYRTGDILADDFVAERVNIETSAEGKIVRLWRG